MDSIGVNLSNSEIGNHEFKRNSMTSIVAYCLKNGSSAGNCSVDVGMKPAKDFFNTIGIEQYNSLAQGGKCDVLYNEVQKYPGENTPPSYDNAYYVVAYLQPIIQNCCKI